MKYLKRFNESNKEQMEKIYKSKWGNHFGKSLDSLNKQNNEIYFELAEILQSKLFDDYNVVATTDEKFDDYDLDDLNCYYPRHKFWSFRAVGVAPIKTSDIGDYPINGLIVYNIGKDEKVEFYNSLISLKDMVKYHFDRIGKELVVSEDPLESGESDYIITLVDSIS